MTDANDQSSGMPSPDIQPGDYLPGGYIFQESSLSEGESETKTFASESPDSESQIGGIGPSVALDVGVDPMKMAARIVSAPALKKSTLVIVLIIGTILGCAGRCVIEIVLANQHSSSLTFWRFGWIWEILFPAFIGLFPPRSRHVDAGMHGFLVVTSRGGKVAQDGRARDSLLAVVRIQASG